MPVISVITGSSSSTLFSFSSGGRMFTRIESANFLQVYTGRLLRSRLFWLKIWTHFHKKCALCQMYTIYPNTKKRIVDRFNERGMLMFKYFAGTRFKSTKKEEGLTDPLLSITLGLQPIACRRIMIAWICQASKGLAGYGIVTNGGKKRGNRH